MAAVTLFTGCGSFVAPDATQSNAGLQAAHHGSWMTPNGTAGYLLYVSNLGNGTVTVYSWQSGALLGAIAGFSKPDGLCVDRADDVYVTDVVLGEIFEYLRYDLSPIRTLIDKHGGTRACSVDPSTGNLAVADRAGILVYHNASGFPRLYKDQSLNSFTFLSYDTNGNLFAEASNSSNQPAFAELPKGGNALGTLTLNKAILVPSGLQWDGKYLAICDTGTNPNEIYAFSISGSTGTLKSTTALDGSHTIEQFWIPNDGTHRGTAIDAANYNGGNVMSWKYPAGGTATQTITNGISVPYGVTISE